MNLEDETTNAAAASSTRRSRSRLPRFGLLTLMLLIAAIAVWIAYWQMMREVHRLELALPGLRDAARQLRVDDPEQYAVVRKHELWNDDFRWDVYLPTGSGYVLRLATQQVDTRGLAEPAEQYAIDAGRHTIQLIHEKDQDQWRIEARVDGRVVLKNTQPLSWDPGRGSSGGSSFDSQSQQERNRPLVLFRRRFMADQGNGSYMTPAGPTAGILLWIEPIEATDP